MKTIKSNGQQVNLLTSEDVGGGANISRGLWILCSCK